MDVPIEIIRPIELFIGKPRAIPAHTIYNFFAGPAVLPEAVLRAAQREILDYNGTDFPVMAVGHHSDMFLSILHHAEHDLHQLLDIPSHYKILFLQDGAITQFNMVAMNLARGFKCAGAVVAGNWSRIAYKQMSRLIDAEIHLAADGGEQFDYTALPVVESWDVGKHSAFVHFTANETIHSPQYRSVPKLSDGLPPSVCDMSSGVLSREFNVNDYDLIYAGAQKNIGPAGATVVIVREDLLERCLRDIPDMFNYQSHIERNGMYNTPTAYPIYMAGLVFRQLLTQGGVKKIGSVNDLKIETFYRAIDGNGGFYIDNIQADARSKMNVIFKTSDPDLNDTFIREARLRRLCVLKGCKLLGEICASIYNTMPLEGAEALAAFM